MVISGGQSQRPTGTNVAGSRDDGINVDPEMTVEIADCSGLTKVFDPERHGTRCALVEWIKLITRPWAQYVI